MKIQKINPSFKGTKLIGSVDIDAKGCIEAVDKNIEKAISEAKCFEKQNIDTFIIKEHFHKQKNKKTFVQTFLLTGENATMVKKLQALVNGTSKTGIWSGLVDDSSGFMKKFQDHLATFFIKNKIKP